MNAVNRVALVTGAGRGIGAATVAQLAAVGWAVLAVDCVTDNPDLPYAMSTPQQLAAVVAAAEEVGGAGCAHQFQADVRDVAGMHAAVAYAETVFGGLDAAIGCAGAIAGGVAQWVVPIEQERAVLDVNLGGIANLARASVPAMLRRPEPRTGRFVAVASAAATRGLPLLAAYCAAKAGVTGLVRALAAELADTGVTANAVSPGSTATAILDESARLYGLADADQFAVQQAHRRLLTADEIAAVLVFLAGSGSSGMTGAVLPVDGGLSL
jgi:SDR family mycofactocin-dependent oxidoreductase